MKGWETKRLGEVCDIRNGSTPAKGNRAYWDGGSIPWFTIDDMRDQGRSISHTRQKITRAALAETSVKLLPERSVLLCCTASVGEYAISQIPLTTNQQFNGLVVRDPHQLAPEFLFHYAATLKDELLGLSGKTTIDFIPISRLRDVVVPLPPLPEQRRIVGILDEAFEGIATAKANAEKNLHNARALFESHLQSVFSRRGEGWVDRTLDQVCIVERGSSPRPIKKYFTTKPDGVNWIKIGDTEEGGKYVFATAQKITPEGAQQSRFVKEGDFILTNSMSFGRPYIMRTTGYIHDGWFVLRLNATIDTDYFYYLLSSRFVQDQFALLASGSVVKNISGDLVKRAILPIPPLAAQHFIVKRLMVLSAETQRLASIYERKLAALEALKKSLLDQAFSGKL